MYTKKDENNKLKYGELIQLNGEYILPEGSRNYKGFNYREYLKTKKIYGSISCQNIKIISNNNLNKVLIFSNIIKNYIIEISKKLLPNKTSSLFCGIIIGETNEISEEVKDSFKTSNLTHILSVSGSHTTYIILGLTYIFIKSKIAKKWTYIFTIIILILLMFITEFTSTVVRACLMSIIMLGANLFYRKSDITSNISISLLIILIMNPFAITEIGLQFSYLGTIGIILLNKNIKNLLIKLKINKKIAELLSITFSAQAMIIPIMALCFNNISFTFFISNFFAGPILGIDIILGFITIFISLISFELAKMLAIFLNIGLEILIYISDITANLPFSSIIIKTPYLTSIIFIYFFIFVTNYLYTLYISKNSLRRFQKKILKKVSFKNIKKLICVMLSTILIFNLCVTEYSKSLKELKIYFIDVGQGDSTLIVTPNLKTILIDGGEEKNILVNYLLDRRIKTIDYIIISHFDSDHCNGLIEVIEKLKVRNILISEQAYYSEDYTNIAKIINQQKINTVFVKQGDSLKIDKDVKIKILYPSKNLEYEDLNNNSIVAKVEYYNFSMLFTGDIEKSEQKILEKYKNTEEIKSTILKISHHGSKTSSSEEFLKEVNPRIALIGVGKNNKFGHPNNGVLERLEKINCKIYRTDEMGEIQIKINEKGKIWIDKMLN